MDQSLSVFLAVFLGGGAGSLCRYMVSLGAHKWFTPFPAATLISNLCASILLVVFSLWMSQTNGSAAQRAFLLIGFCGGFSTFSTFSWETFQLWKSGHLLLACLNILLSVGACVFAVYLIARNWNGGEGL